MKYVIITILGLIFSLKSISQVTADFSVSDTTSCDILNAHFTDLSSPNVTSWYWDFGNGQTSTNQNPSNQIYWGAGTSYSIKLKVSNGISSDSIVKTNLIKIYGSPNTVFTYTPSNPTTSDSIQFINQTIGSVEYLWLFELSNNHDTSILENPKYLFNTPGNKWVCLVTYNDSITNNLCHDTTCQLLTILPSTTSINEFIYNNISLYPNPTSSQVTIRFGELKKAPIIKIRNQLGQLVFTKKYNNTNQIDLDLDVLNGVYFLQIESEGEIINKKIIKQ
ncbi:MAG: T9SS type A sorting domain-containing protein [Flavobacteriales bacterium]|nr:T9SS type A sorting domain-containing protein [Flavobacteriales bacterium]